MSTDAKYDVSIPSTDFTPRIRENLCIIVVGLVFQNNQVLLIREAKESCRGKYFLPAGRLEVNESVTDGLRREVAEESGLQVDPQQIVLVESNGPFWLSITFWSTVNGGTLKTIPDSESMEGRWFDLDTVRVAEERWKHSRHRRCDLDSNQFELRAPILYMIEAGLRLRMSQTSPHDPIPLMSSHCDDTDLDYMVYRFAIVWSTGIHASQCLVRKRSKGFLPSVRINGSTLLEAMVAILKVVFTEEPIDGQLYSHFLHPRRHIDVIGLEFHQRIAVHRGDGLSMIFRLTLDSQLFTQRPIPDSQFCWLDVPPSDFADTYPFSHLHLPADDYLFPRFHFHK